MGFIGHQECDFDLIYWVIWYNKYSTKHAAKNYKSLKVCT